MCDKTSKKRALLKFLIVYFSTCNTINTLRCYTSEYTHYALIIASCIILTINGKLLMYFDYPKLNHVSAYVTCVCYLVMAHVQKYRNVVISLCLQMVIGTKYIVFDSVHQILHITHKKNIIDKYIGVEIIAMSLGSVSIYFMPYMYLYYFMIFCTMMQILCEHRIIRYYNKDVEFLECITQLDHF